METPRCNTLTVAIRLAERGKNSQNQSSVSLLSNFAEV